jgi:hypothetical protein
VQEDSADEGELAGLYNPGEQPMTARPQVTQSVDDAVLFGAGDLSDGSWQGIGHSHTEGPKRPPVNGLAVGVDEVRGFVEPLTAVNGAAQHHRVNAVEASGRARWLI